VFSASRSDQRIHEQGAAAGGVHSQELPPYFNSGSLCIEKEKEKQIPDRKVGLNRLKKDERQEDEQENQKKKTNRKRTVK